MFDPNCGVYVITTPSGKRYVGQSVNIKSRWIRHRADLRSGKHVNKKLINAARKYGVDSLVFSVWCNCAKLDLGRLEILAHSELHPELNIGACGDAPGLGRKLSDAAKKSISEKNFGKKRTPESVARIRESRVGSVCSDTTREKMRAAMLGRRHTHDSLVRIAAAAKLRSESPDTRSKLSEAQRAYWARTDDQVVRERMAKAWAGQKPIKVTPVRCIDTGEGFKSLEDLQELRGYDPFSIARVCRGKRKTAYGLRWEFFG